MSLKWVGLHFEHFRFDRFNQGIKSEFRGARDFNSMNVWATKAGADSGLKILKDDEELIKANQREEVVFLWLHEGEGEKVGENLQQVSDLACQF